MIVFPLPNTKKCTLVFFVSISLTKYFSIAKCTKMWQNRPIFAQFCVTLKRDYRNAMLISRASWNGANRRFNGFSILFVWEGEEGGRGAIELRAKACQNCRYLTCYFTYMSYVSVYLEKEA